MKVIIKDTGKRESLSIIIDGIDQARDIFGSFDCDYNIGETPDIGQYVERDPETDTYTMSQADYEWWDDYLSDYGNDMEAMDELISKYGDEARDIIREELEGNGDADHQHSAYQRAFDRIREQR